MLFLVCHLHLALFAEISWKARCFFGHCRPNVVLNGVNHVNLLPPELMSTLPNYAHACWVLQRGAAHVRLELQKAKGGSIGSICWPHDGQDLMGNEIQGVFAQLPVKSQHVKGSLAQIQL